VDTSQVGSFEVVHALLYAIPYDCPAFLRAGEKDSEWAWPFDKEMRFCRDKNCEGFQGRRGVDDPLVSIQLELSNVLNSIVCRRNPQDVRVVIAAE
jgi:hypothetical protein